MRYALKICVSFLLAAGFWAADIQAAWGRDAGLPASAYVQGVAGHPQAYTLSCESRSAADWALFWGVSVSETEFLYRLPRSDNPNAGFVGDPNGVWGATPPASYGVYARPVADLLRAYGLDAEANYGLSWDNLRAEIAEGRPVIVWVIGQMWNGNGFSYEASDGETVRVAAFEHSMIVVGYDENWVQAVDASTGLTQSYAVAAFLRSWEVLGNMAVTGGKSETGETVQDQEQPSPNPAYAGDTYTVQRGDYLVALAKAFGFEWLELATINNMYYPFTLYPGQVLKLPERELPEDAAPPSIDEPPAAPPEEPAPTEPPPAAQAPPGAVLGPDSQARPPAPLVSYTFIILGEPNRVFFPILTQQNPSPVPLLEDDVVAAGICLFTRSGNLYVKPASFFRGWCISADRIRPEYLLGLAGSIPELP